MAWKNKKEYPNGTNPYHTTEYRTNRAIVMQRDFGMCVRCWQLWKVIRLDVQCDHLRNVATASGEVDNSVRNLWMLCTDCHDEKTRRESNGKTLFKQLKDDLGYAIREPNYYALVASGKTIDPENF